MAAAPAAAAVWADVLWCLGLGCLLWAVRDGAELLVGRGRCAALCWTCWPLQRLQCCWWASRRASARPGWPLVHGGGAGCRGTGLAESHRAAAACLDRMDRPIAAGPGSLGAAVHCRTAAQSRLRPSGSTEKALLSPPTAEKSGKIKKIWKKPVAKEVEDII